MPSSRIDRCRRVSRSSMVTCPLEARACSVVLVSGLAVVVAAIRTVRAQDGRRGQGSLRLPAAAHREVVGVCADAGDDGRRAVWM